MKIIFQLPIAIFMLMACNPSTKAGKDGETKTTVPVKTDSTGKKNTGTKIPDPKKLFTLADAESIMGEPAHLTDSATKISPGVTYYNYSFTANKKEAKKDRPGSIYYMVEQYVRDSSAKRVYTSIKKSNEDHGIKDINNLGDEAYFHTDNTNFYFILVRKGTNMLRMKVNKITGHTSLKDFNRVAMEISAKL